MYKSPFKRGGGERGGLDEERERIEKLWEKIQNFDLKLKIIFRKEGWRDKK